MKLDIHVEISAATARRIGVVAASLIVVGTGAVVYADQITFSAGQTLTAAALNANFDELYAWQAKPSITVGAASISVGGTFCSSTETTYTGAEVGGYSGAKDKCEAACGSPTAHLCSAEE